MSAYGDLLIDEAWARADPGAAKAAGYKGIIGYLSTDPSKNLTRTNIDLAHAHGLDIGLVWETTTSAALQGHAFGAAHAQTANSQADALGAPRTMTLYMAVDTDTTADAVRPYFQGADSISGARPPGVYGGINVVDPLLADGTVRWGWQTVAWSGGQVSQRAHLYQRVTHTHPISGIAIGDWDEDVVLAHGAPSWGQWYAGATPTPTPAPTPSPAPPPVAPRPYPGHPIAIGATGDDVKAIQTGINQRGYQPALAVDGDFGPLTQTGVIWWQTRRYATGIIDQTGWAALITAS